MNGQAESDLVQTLKEKQAATQRERDEAVAAKNAAEVCSFLAFKCTLYLSVCFGRTLKSCHQTHSCGDADLYGLGKPGARQDRPYVS